jgi:hypothetical protein
VVPPAALSPPSGFEGLARTRGPLFGDRAGKASFEGTYRLEIDMSFTRVDVAEEREAHARARLG